MFSFCSAEHLFQFRTGALPTAVSPAAPPPPFLSRAARHTRFLCPPLSSPPLPAERPFRVAYVDRQQITPLMCELRGCCPVTLLAGIPAGYVPPTLCLALCVFCGGLCRVAFVLAFPAVL